MTDHETRPRSLRPSRRSNRRFAIVGVLAVLAILVGLVGPSAWAKVTGTSAASSTSSAKDRIAANPPPDLFPSSAVTATASDVAAQHQQAARMIRTWAATTRDEHRRQGVRRLAGEALPGPPASLASEMPTVVALEKSRTPAGTKAATWLESYGKKDIWKLYAHDQKEVLDSSTGKDRKAEEKAVLKMSKQVADALGARFGSSAPYVRMPALRPDHTVTKGQKCPCSYPSRHATAAAASRTVLGTLMPDRGDQYRAMEAQIDYSRVYMAGHFPGDIRGGAVLGDVIGDYFLITRDGVEPQGLR